jgi:hypothetical protein
MHIRKTPDRALFLEGVFDRWVWKVETGIRRLKLASAGRDQHSLVESP